MNLGRTTRLGLWALLASVTALGACSRTKANEPSSTAAAAAAATTPPDAGASSGDGALEGPPAITFAEICGANVDARTSSLPDKKPFSAIDARCTGDDPFCDHVEKSPDPKDRCFVADDNIARAEREARAAGPAFASGPWDGVATPKYLDRVDAHLHLTPSEKEKLAANGFVVLDRLAYTDYASAFHDVFQQQLPLFVGVDAILHAVFRGTELALERTERKRLVPALHSMLRKLRGGLAGSGFDAETRADLDTYLGVAWALAQKPSFDDKPKRRTALPGGNDEEIEALVAEATSSRADLTRVSLFGRERMIDFSALTPRGHYAVEHYPEPSLEPYFRAMMWLSRLELNIVSRGARSSHPGPAPEPAETPREVKAALALAELIERTGAAEEVRLFEAIYSTFGGKREDIPPSKLLEIARSNKTSRTDPEATDKLKAAIGASFPRTARTHFTLEGAPDLPAITTLFGPRIAPDIRPLTRLVHDTLPGRYMLGAGDVGFLLGHDRARAFIPDADKSPLLGTALAGARDELQTSARTNDVYGMWLSAILALGQKPTGVVPSFAQRDAYADHRLNSAIVGYGQLRHTFVLLSAQGYDSYGCEIPDAYVEPLPGVFDAMLAHVRGMRAKAKGWQGLERVLSVLARIAHDETTGRALTEPQRRWLAMVSEYIPKDGWIDSGEPPKWTGWYFDMFDDREHGALKNTSFIADYFTLTNAGNVAYLGGEGPRLGVFIVDTNGEPRAMVGPVAKGFEAHGPIAERFADDAVFGPAVARKAPWRQSYAEDRPEPALGLEAHVVRCEPKGEWRIAVRSDRPAGATSVTLLDHHGDPLTKELALDVKRTWSIGSFDMPADLAASKWGVEAVHLHIDDLAPSKTGTGPFDFTTTPNHLYGDERPPNMPDRARRTESFSIGLDGGPRKIEQPAAPVPSPGGL